MAGTRRKGHSILAFFLGVLFGIIFILGGIAVAVYVALTYNLDKLSVNKDSDGNYIYINADPDSGGVTNLLELINALISFSQDTSSMTLGRLESLLPVTTKLSDVLINALGSYIDFDADDLRATAITALASFLTEALMDTRISTVLSTVDTSGLESNALAAALLYGVEAGTVTDEEGIYVVYYESFSLQSDDEEEQSEEESDDDSDESEEEDNEAETQSASAKAFADTVAEDGYLRGDGAALDSALAEYLVKTGSGYRLYFFETADGCYVTYKDEDGNYVYTATSEFAYEYYESSPTGNYYYVNGEKVYIEGMENTVRDFADGSALDVLDNYYVTDMMGEDDDLAQVVLGGVTLGDLMNGNVNFTEIIDDVKITALMDADVSSAILVYITYGITGIYKEVLTEDDEGYTEGETTYRYVGCYTDGDGVEHKCYLGTETDEESGKTLVTGAYYYADENGGDSITYVEANTVGNIEDSISDIQDKLAIADLIYINAPTFVYDGDSGTYTVTDKNAIVIYLAFSITDIEMIAEGEEYYGEYTLRGIYHYTATETVAVTDDNGNAVTEEQEVEKTAVCYIVTDTYTSSSTGAETLYIANAFYLAEVGGEDGAITYEWTSIHKTTLNDLPSQVEGLTTTMTIGQIVGDTSGNKVLDAIKDSTISNLSDSIANVTINEIYAESIYSRSSSSEETVQLYLAVSASNATMCKLDSGIQWDGVKNNYYNYIFYVEDENGAYTVAVGDNDTKFSLATTTGKLTEDTFNSETQYYYVILESSDEGDDNDTSKENENSDTVLYILYDAAFLYYTYDQDSNKYTLEGNISDNDEFEKGTYYTYGSPNALWKLLLYVTPDKESNETDKYEKSYSINNVSSMVTNITTSIQSATIGELVEAGILTISSEYTLSDDFKNMTLTDVIESYLESSSENNQGSKGDGG